MKRGHDPNGGDYIEFNYDYLDDSYTDYDQLKNSTKVPQIKGECSILTYFSLDKVNYLLFHEN